MLNLLISAQSIINIISIMTRRMTCTRREEANNLNGEGQELYRNFGLIINWKEK